MNQLETNLILWAICSILLFEILIIICLCRCCFNRIKPKKFYIKRDEYEYTPEISGGTLSKYPATILRPPRADELAHIGTIRLQNGLENRGFNRDEQDETISSSQQWFELQSPMTNTGQLPPSDYETYPYSTDDYSYRQPPPRPIFIDFHSYRDEDDEIKNYRLGPQIHRLDTSTEYYGMRYSNVMPKSILKSGTNITPPIDIPSTDYLEIEHHESLPKISNATKRRIPIETIFSPTIPKYRMKFAYINQLNDINWEIPGEFRTIFQLNNERMASPSGMENSWQRRTNSSQPYHSWSGGLTQEKAFEY